MFQMRVEGGKELAAAFRSLPTRVAKRTLTGVLRDVGEPMRASMAQKAPRAPGAPDIADNIVISSTNKLGWDADGDVIRADEFQAAVAIGPAKGFFYGFFLEFGTVKMGAQAFVRPAFDSGVARAVTEIGRRLWVELAAIGVSRSRTSSGSLSEGGFSGSAGLGEGNVQRRGGTGL